MNITLGVLTFLLLAPCATGNPSRAQSCNPAVVNYIVRDEGGKGLSESELKSVYEQLPKSIGDARIDVGEVSFAEYQTALPALRRKFYVPSSCFLPGLIAKTRTPAQSSEAARRPIPAEWAPVLSFR